MAKKTNNSNLNGKLSNNEKRNGRVSSNVNLPHDNNFSKQIKSSNHKFTVGKNSEYQTRANYTTNLNGATTQHRPKLVPTNAQQNHIDTSINLSQLNTQNNNIAKIQNPMQGSTMPNGISQIGSQKFGATANSNTVSSVGYNNNQIKSNLVPNNDSVGNQSIIKTLAPPPSRANVNFQSSKNYSESHLVQKNSATTVVTKKSNKKPAIIVSILLIVLLAIGGTVAYLLLSKPSVAAPLFYTVTFDSNGGTQIPSQSIKENQKLNIPPQPVKKGYIFDNWYKDSNITLLWDMDEDKVVKDTTLYAGWTLDNSGIEKVVVEFDSKGGSFVPAQLVEKGGFVQEPKIPLNEGFMFDAWYTDAVNKIPNMRWYFEKYTVSSDITLYARWDTIPPSVSVYSITFLDYDGTTELFNPQHYEQGSLINTLPTPSRDGYQFVNWYFDLQMTTPITLPYTISSDIVLYAGYQTKTFNINYSDMYGGVYSGNNLDDLVKSHTFGMDTILVDGVKTGFYFAGWFRDSNGEDKVPTNSNGEFVLDANTYFSDITLYAGWSQNRYTVTYQPNKPSNASNDITGNTADSEHFYGTNGSLSKNGFALVGWNFVEWNTQADGFGVGYQSGSNVNDLTTENNGVVTLYAIWRQNQYTIKYDKNKPSNASNGVLGNMDDTVAKYDQEVKLADNVYSLKGWKFVNWYTDQNQTNTIADGEVVKNLSQVGGATVFLYAHFEATRYTIKFDSNKPNIASQNVTGTMSDIPMEFDDGVALPTSDYKLYGWELEGFNTQPDGSGQGFVIGDQLINLNEINDNVVDNATITLYAIWRQYTFEIVYDSNIPSNASSNIVGSMPNDTFNFDQDSNLSSNNYTLQGWTFKEWNTSPDGSGKGFVDGAIVKGSDADSNRQLKLYAIWTANTYDIVFDGNKPVNASNNITGTMSKQKLTYDTQTKLNANLYGLYGWDFVGWNTQPDGSGINYLDEASVANLVTSGEITLHAVWQAKNFAVNILDDAQIIDSIGVTFDSPYNNIVVPIKQGYDFVGVYNTPNINATSVQYFDEFGSPTLTKWDTVETPIDLYAIFKEQVYTITLDYQGGHLDDPNNTQEPSTHIFGTDTYLPLATYGANASTSNGKMGFNGWYLDSSYTQAVEFDYDNEQFYIGANTIFANTTLYARWYEFEIDGSTKNIKANSVSNPDGVVFVPRQIDDNDINGIEDFGFSNSTNLLYMGYRIDYAIQYIGIGAFQNNTNLKVAKIPSIAYNGSIGLQAFFNTNSLKKFVSIDNGTTPYVADDSGKVLYFIGRTATISYYANNNGDTNYTIENYFDIEGIEYVVTEIDQYAFANSTTLETITIPSTVTQINGNAFSNIITLTTINLLASNPITKLGGNNVFANSDNIVAINVPMGSLNSYLTDTTWSAYKDKNWWNEV